MALVKYKDKNKEGYSNPEAGTVMIYACTCPNRSHSLLHFNFNNHYLYVYIPALALGPPLEELYSGAWSFNAVLTASSLNGFFFVITPASSVATFFAGKIVFIFFFSIFSDCLFLLTFQFYYLKLLL